MKNIDRFMSVYEQKLKFSIEQHPEKYPFREDKIPMVVEKVKFHLSSNMFVLNDAFKLTCKELGISYRDDGSQVFNFLRGK